MSALSRWFRNIAAKIEFCINELFDIYKELVDDGYGK